MRVKLDPRDGTAMTVFHVTETGTYEVKAVTQVAGHDLQGSDTVQVREQSSPDPVSAGGSFRTYSPATHRSVSPLRRRDDHVRNCGRSRQPLNCGFSN